jgi:DNA-binding MarR family transcriptional regulator
MEPNENDVPNEHLYARAPRSPSGLAVVAALQALSQRSQDASALALRHLGVGSLDARALLFVAQRVRHGVVVRPSDLVVSLKVSSAAITKLVDRLVAAGRLERRPNPHDRRGLVLFPAPHTVEEIEAAYRHIHAPLVEVVDGLTDEELDVVARFSSRLAEAFRIETMRALPPDAPSI